MSSSNSKQQARTRKPLDGLTKVALVDPLAKQVNLCGVSKDGEEKVPGPECGEADLEKVASKVAPLKHSK